ncbi:MAG: strawberry notch family protein, partial [Colwellia sp.]|nr:strawberry notch family protein [Colwellia sp.]
MSKDLKSQHELHGIAMEKRVNNGSEYPVQSEVVLGRPPKEGVPEVKVKLHRSTRKKFLGKITRSSEVADFIRSIFKRGEIQVQEQFIVLYLNRSNQILGYYKHSIGGISGTLADVRLILSTALKTTSVAIILAHNHPSSNTQPSEADKKITQKIANAAKLMDISVLDHVIITKDSYYSFADEGLMGLDGIEGIKTSPSNNEKTTFVHIVESDLKEKRKRNKRDYEKLAAHYGITDRTLVKELTEFAIVNVARKIAHSPGTVKERFNKIVELYNRQVNLSHRTSQSILLQQYSTPAPIGYLAGIFCGIDQKGYYFEPSAGNGLLTIAGSPENFVVNEIDTVRNENLQKQGFDKVFSIDATQDFVLSNHTTFFQNVKFDAVITNPPFGRLDTPIHYENYPIHDLDHLMVLRSLDLMKDNGKAAIIIGGHSKWDEKGRIRRGKNRILFNYLFSRYHVADVIQVDGKKLYSRQGTAFPVRLILIDGRKANPKGAAPIYDKQEDKVVSTFNELYERVMDAMDHKENKIQISKDVYQAKLIKRYRQLKEKHPNPILLLRQSELYYVFEDDAIRVSKITGSVLTKLKDAKGKMIFATTLNPFEAAERHLKEITRQGYKVALADELQSPDSLKSKALTLKNKLLGNDGLAGPYNPGSDACVVLHTQVPDSMDFETHEAINQIRKAVGGDFDEFVKQRLGYHNQKELCAALAAEQIDAVALAIYNIEARGQGTIIGDQTGIGKGRIAAAMIRYAVQRGKQPIFLTEKANLFSDIYRDLKAIGSANLVPFILNSRESKTNIKNEDGQIIYQAPEPEEQQRILRDQKLPSTYDFNIATYSQVNSPEKKPLKPLYLAANAKGNIMVMDESHNASGSSNTGSYLRAIAGDTDGMVFLSATFAKRPENLAIYAMKTAISEANMTTDELVDAISKGGVAMQEILASQLVREGQMLRRERSFEGVKVNYEIMDSQALEHRAIADNITEILREIISFQANGIKKKVDEIDEIVKAEGKEVKERGGTTRLGVDNQPVFSKVFNLVHQLLLALKAETVAEQAI